MSTDQENKPAAGPGDSRRLLLVAVVVGGLSWAAYFLASRPGEDGSVAAPALPLETWVPPSDGENPEGEIRPGLARALDLTAGADPAERLILIRGTSDDLAEGEMDAVLVAMLAPPRPGETAGWYSEYVHELSLLMQRQSSGHGKFARALATLAGDPNREEVVRDYALQHLRRVWNVAIGTEGLRGSIEATFREIAAGTGPMSASALLSLHLLGTRFDPPARADIPGTVRPLEAFALPDEEIEPVVAGILAEEAAPDRIKSRLTAIRVVADRRLASRRDDLRRLVADAAEHTMVRMAAIAAISRFGDASDKAHLESLDRTDPRIDRALRHALAYLP